MPSGEERDVAESVLNIEAEEGRMLKDGDRNKIVLGNNFKKEDIYGKPIRIGDKVNINDIKFEVVGILKKKGSFIWDNIVLMEEEDLLEHLRENDDEVDIIAVKVKDEDYIKETKQDIEKLLRKERDVKEGEEDFEVESPESSLESLNSTLFAVQLFVYIIASISLFVGGIGIMNTMYTAVLERTKEIGIMKSIGAKNSDIFSIFLIESGILGMVGGLIGILLGLGFAYGLAAAGRAALGVELIQAQVSIGVIIGSLVFSFVLGTVFGVTPAYQASQLQPVESLRSVK
jgi:putative ABC transport system permease protein